MKSVKGIGAKTAQRIIIDLQDKLGAIDAPVCPFQAERKAGTPQEALIALTTLVSTEPVVKRHWTK